MSRSRAIIVLDRRGYFRAFGMDPGKADKPSVAAPGVNVDELNAGTVSAPMAAAAGSSSARCTL